MDRVSLGLTIILSIIIGYVLFSLYMLTYFSEPDIFIYMLYIACAFFLGLMTVPMFKIIAKSDAE